MVQLANNYIKKGDRDIKPLKTDEQTKRERERERERRAGGRGGGITGIRHSSTSTG